MQRQLSQESAEAQMHRLNMTDSDTAATGFIREVRTKVEHIWVQPEGVSNDEFVTVEVELSDGGVVKKIEIMQASNYRQLNDSALLAIIQAAPFSSYRDLPPDQQADLSRFVLRFTPKH